MVRRFDCAVLSLAAFEPWLGASWRTPVLGPVHLHAVPLADAGWNGDVGMRASYTTQACQALARQAPQLQRFDLCVLPVSPETLGWTRVALASALGTLPVPLVLAVRQVAAGALGDLLALGATDFLAHGARPDEIKARLCRWAMRRPASAPAASPPPVPPSVSEHVLAEPPPGLQALSAAAEPSASYRATRADVLARFERDYVTGMLARFRGNVTHAARAGHQDRRAFWQLMRKYGVLSADFRQAALQGQTAAGGNR